MAVKRTKNRACVSKKRHAAERGALAQIERLERQFGAPPGAYMTYECKHCAGWHVGHRSDRYRQQEA